MLEDAQEIQNKTRQNKRVSRASNLTKRKSDFNKQGDKIIDPPIWL
jgi:hypothetical protein